MVLPRFTLDNRPVWYDQQQLPSPEDFTDDASYQQALADYVKLVNGTEPAFAPPTQREFTREDGSTGIWYTAGNTSAQGQTPGEYWANYLNNMITSGQGPYTPNMNVRLWMQNHPEAAQAAYNAIRTDGTPVLLDPILVMLERAGLRPTVASSAGPVTSPGGPGFTDQPMLPGPPAAGGDGEPIAGGEAPNPVTGIPPRAPYGKPATQGQPNAVTGIMPRDPYGKPVSQTQPGDAATNQMTAGGGGDALLSQLFASGASAPGFNMGPSGAEPAAINPEDYPPVILNWLRSRRSRLLAGY